MKPVTPEELRPSDTVPDEWVRVTNELIQHGYCRGGARLYEDEVAPLLAKATGQTTADLYEAEPFDRLHTVYTKAGWRVMSWIDSSGRTVWTFTDPLRENHA